MHQAIEPHELTQIDLARFQVVQVSDGANTVVLWEAEDPPLHVEACTLTIRLCDPLNPVRKKDVCERLQAHLNASRETRLHARDANVISLGSRLPETTRARHPANKAR